MMINLSCLSSNPTFRDSFLAGVRAPLPKSSRSLYGPCKTSNPISVRKCDKFPVVGWFAHSSPPIKESTVTSDTGKEIRKVK